MSGDSRLDAQRTAYWTRAWVVAVVYVACFVWSANKVDEHYDLVGPVTLVLLVTSWVLGLASEPRSFGFWSSIATGLVLGVGGVAALLVLAISQMGS